MEYKGLSSSQVTVLQSKHGYNRVAQKSESNAFIILLQQFKSPLIYILIFASLLSIVLDEYKDAVFILIVVGINTALGFIQEYRAEKALEKLTEGIKSFAKVLRDGKKVSIDTEKLVPGDIVFLEPGIRVPADGEIIKETDVLIDESLITGEAEPVKKIVGDESQNKMFMGTLVAQGIGLMKILSIGENTTYGKIAESLKGQRSVKTPTQKRLNTLSKFITIFIIIITIFIVALGFYQGRDIEDVILTGIALGVSTIPEGLIIAYTVVLALGMNRIVKKKAIVKNLPAAETLGGVDILCIDKTGTLTYGKMKVDGYVADDLESILYAITLSNNDTNYVDQALKDFVIDQKGDDYWFEQIEKRVEQIPFSSKIKYTAAFDGRKITMVGSPESVIEATGGSQNLYDQAIEKAEQGNRVLAVASKWVEEGRSHISHEDLNEMQFEGFIFITDPVRQSVKQSLDQVEEAGIEIKVITGDLKATALGILRSLDYSVNENEIMSGKELREYADDPSLKDLIRKTKLFYRTTPDQKLTIVQNLQSQDLTVGMMGDGINDSPAIKNSEIGISVDSATDVSKEASDIVLLDTNFQTIVDAVEEGRKIFINLKKIFVYLLTHSLSETILIVLAIVFDLPLPLIPLQILWINLIEDGLPSISLAFENTDENLLTKKHKEDNKKILDPFLITSIMLISLVIDTIFFIFYKLLLDGGYDIAVAQTMMFAGIAFSSLLFLFSAKTIDSNIWKVNIFNDVVVNLSVILGFNLLLAAIYIEPLQKLLKTVPLNLEQVGLVLLISVIDIFIIEVTKIVVRKIHN